MNKLSSLLVLGIAALASAADTPGSSTRTCRMLYFQAPFDAPEKVVLVVGKESTDFDLPRLTISAARAKLPSGVVRVYAALKAPTKAEPLPENTPFTDIPEAMSDALIVLLPTGQPGPLSFIMLPVEFHKNRAPEGAVVWFNLSDRIIYAKLGNATVTVNPKGSALCMPTVGIDEPYVVYVDASPVPRRRRPFPSCAEAGSRKPACATCSSSCLTRPGRCPASCRSPIASMPSPIPTPRVVMVRWAGSPR